MMPRRSSLSMLLVPVCLAAPAAAKEDTDARIVSAAQKSYTFRVYLKDDAVEVASRGGAVTLTGTVANEFHKDLAQETVQSLPGVKSVDNRLLVRAGAPGTASDAWLATKVSTALSWHRNVDASATQVSAHDGVVTLSGRVSSPAHRALAEDIARNVEGVKDVKDDLEVAAAAPSRKTLAEKIDDASITAQVKAALLAHRGTHMLTTRVKTDRGLVTIRGEARNSAEKELVTRLVADLRGVRKIQNRMTVAQ